MAGFGGSVKLTGESEYRKALKSITDNLTVLSSEMKVVNSLYDKNDTSTAKLSQANEVLTKKLEAQNSKLAEAKKMLDQAKNSTDSNAQTVAKWQNEVNKAQAEVNQTTKEIKDNTAQIKKNEEALDDAGDELKDFKKGEDEAGQSAVKMGDLIKANLISEAIIGGLKALGSAMVELSKKAFELGKQAIASYAEYEQLIGGVETLFKESSGVVEEYANNAYKTAGLSANEYMSTVTSFTASLLQSLNGDTAKSAEVANMAITDMADNANKMGTSMEMIQNAYQGFAKQNYTMLDNLKLGYGGTKGEMERLLQDATAISGVEYDLSNLNDVYQAIHIIQGELGITGTTAKEASTTIEGSTASMKSAWQNLLTGMADDDADFGLLIGNFVDSILTVGDNLLPRIQTVIQGMGELVSGLLSELVPEIVNIIPPMIESTLPTLITAVETAIQGIVAVLPQITQSISELLPVVLTSLIGMLPSIVDAGVQMILALVNGIIASIPTLIPAIVDAVITIATNLLANIDMIIDAGIALIVGLGEGLINAIPVLVERLPEIISSLIHGLMVSLPKFLSMGMTIVVQLGAGLISAIPKLIGEIPKIIGGILEGLGAGIVDIYNVGRELLSGLWDGISSWAVDLWQNVKDLGNNIVNWFCDIFDINSPSKVFADKIGKNLALGLGVGFEDTMSDVNDQMASAIPTEFDVSANATVGTGAGVNTFLNMVEAFKQALKEVSIVLDDEVAGRFVTDTVERVIYN
jgi:predicted  nucleic acid-binding Zn-ribbon protein